MKQRDRFIGMQCFVRKENKYLMLQRKSTKRIMPNVWMASGGKREFNEVLFAAARREVFEETGLTIKNLQVKATGNAYCQDIDQEIFFHLLTAEYSGGNVVTQCPEGTLQWFSATAIAKLPNLLAELREVLQYVLTTDKTPVLSYTATYSTGNTLHALTIEKP